MVGFFLLPFIISFCDFRVVRPVSLTGDKNYAEKHENNEKKKTTLKLLEQYPENNSINFIEKRIKLKFNEKIDLDKKKIHFQPFLQNYNECFDYEIKGEYLIINIVKPLQKDTTYQINLTEAVKDLDGNKAENVVISFATGKEFNRGVLSGKVKELMTNKNASNCLVALYKTDRFIEVDDNNQKRKISVHILNEENPDYFIRTDEEGNYKIKYIANGEYFVCAGETMEGKLMSDPKKNKYGFCAEPIVIQNNEINKDIDILLADVEKFKIIEQKIEGDFFIVKFNREIKDFKFKLLINSKKFSQCLKTATIDDTHCSIIFDCNNFDGVLANIDKLPCEITAYDYFGEFLQKKVEVRFGSKNIEKKIQSKKTNVKITHSDKLLTTKSLIDFNIISEKNIARIDKTKIELFFKNKVGTKYTIPEIPLDFKIEEDEKIIHIYNNNSIEDILDIAMKSVNDTDNQFSQIRYDDIIFEIVIKPQGIIFADRSTNEESFSQTFVFAKNFGTIMGKVKAKGKHFKVQLLNKNFEIIDERLDNNIFTFEKIKKGIYLIRVLVWDIDSPQWSFGNIYHKKEHDTVVFYEKEIEIINNSKISDVNFDFN